MALTLEQQKAIAIATAKAKAKQRAEAQTPAATPQAAPQSQPNSFVDMARSVPGGLAKGAAAIVGLPGDIGDALNYGFNSGLDYLTGRKEPTPYLQSPLSSGNIANAVAKPAGGFYQPQTTPGQYAETISSFAPAAVAPGGLLTRGARVAVPGALSETAGQLTKDTPVEPYARIAGALTGGAVTELAPVAARTVGRAANVATERLTGRAFGNPETQAINRIQEAINREGGAGPVTQALNEWARTDASNPALIDVAGGNVRRLVRAAASGSEGEAQNTAQAYLDRIQAGLQDEASRITRALPPTGTPLNAGQYSDDLSAMQQHMARNEYRVPYSEPASVTPEMVSALQGPEGRAAIGRALRGASSNRDAQQMGELRDLLGVAGQQSGGRDPITGRIRSLEQALSELSSGSLDRVRIAMREMGRAHAQAGHGDISRGLRNRVGDIDTALNQTPGLQDARASYRQNQAMIDAVEHGRQGFTQPTSAFVPELRRLQGISPNAQIGAGVGYRQSLLDAIERPAAGATGNLNRIASAPQQTQNLSATFGQPAAERYQASIANEIARLRNARGISPNTGSQTAMRLEESALVDAIPFGQKAGMLARVVDAIRSHVTLTNAEKAAIVRLGTSEADIRRVLQNLPRRSNLAIAQQILVTNPAIAQSGAAPP